MKTGCKTLLSVLILAMALFFGGCKSNTETIDINEWKNHLASQETDNVMDNQEDVITDITDQSRNLGQKLQEVLDMDNMIPDQYTEIGKSMTDQLKEWFQEGTDAITDISKENLPTNDRVKVEFVRVVDGDTIVITYQGENTKVRLIGINSPESVHQDEEKNTEEGENASNFLKKLMNDVDYVWLEFDSDTEDDYGRLLAYVWLNNDGDDVGKDMLNGLILQSGYAEIMQIDPNERYAEIFNNIATESTP